MTRIRAPGAPPVRNPTHPPAEQKGVQLSPIPWGKPDPQLAKALCWHISDATPAIVVRFNPFTHRRLSRYLRSCGIQH